MAAIDDTVARLLRTFHVGDRVRAELTIFYASLGLEVAEGGLGTIRAIEDNLPLARIEWDTHPGIKAPTGFDAFDPVPTPEQAEMIRWGL